MIVAGWTFCARGPYGTPRLGTLGGALLVTASILFSPSSAVAQPATTAAVLTQHNDNGRTGANLAETQLNTGNVNTNQFGLLYRRAVDDQIYAEPLILTNVNIPSRGVHNVVYVATVNDTVYAFDADDGTVTSAYWTRSFINPPNIVPPRNTDMTGACGGNYTDFSGKFGIVGTPVIDPSTGTLYLVARAREFGTNFVQRLHALDVATGAERSNSPVVIAATNGVAFDPYKQNQRPALLLAGGYVFIAWSSHCDWQPYHGWVIGYNTANLAQAPITFNDTPGGGQGGIWMSNQGPAADTNGNVFVSTGNGTFDGINNFGECFLKLTNTGPALAVANWFAPYNWNSLNNSDLDLGTGGVLLIPGTSLIFGGGKAGVLYLANRDRMGGVSGALADTNIVQSWSIGSHEIHSGPVWWTGPASYAYVWGDSSDRLRQYQFTNNTKFNTNPIAMGPTVGGTGSPGGIMALSANGTNAGTGILWATANTTADAGYSPVAGTLHAYDAGNVANELWNSDMVSARDSLGNLAKFVAPAIANGKVYVATFSGALDVYGLLPPPDALQITPGVSLAFNRVGGGPFNPATQSYTLTNAGSAPLGWSMSNTSLWFTALPAGGVLSPGGSAAAVTVSVDGIAAGLPAINYTNNLWFTNLNNSVVQGREVVLLTQPVVRNGGFETGDFSDWILSGIVAGNLVTNRSEDVQSGNYGARLGATGGLGYLSQTLPTAAGPYLLSLWLHSPGDKPNEFLVAWNGSTLFDQTNLPAIVWTNLQFLVRATGSSTALEFGFRDDPSALGLDDISATPVIAPAFQGAIATRGVLTLNWSAQAGLNYQAQYKTNLNQANWINLGNSMIATNAIVTLTDPIGPAAQKFYRLAVTP